jgi:hypothetical protein
MTTYEELLEEARTKVQSFQQSTAKEYVPKMYWKLRAENPELAPEDARDRIEKDCVGIWSKRTVSEYLPDLKKQKAGRLRQKGANSAAFSAALPQEMITVPYQETYNEDLVTEVGGVAVSNSTLPSCLEETSYPDLKRDENGTIARLDFWFPLEDMRRYLQKSFNIDKIKDRLWFNLTVDMNSGVVLSASIGKAMQVSATSNGDENPNVRYY